jgi:hypothetical protein
MDLKAVKEFVTENKSQSHLCICNTGLFEATIQNGVYGFPHSGVTRLKSFWRSIAGLSNIGPNDLVFIYRTNGTHEGCKEIHGPFKIHTIDNIPSVYYDLNSKDFPMKINGDIDCKARFLFESFDNKVYSISDNFELIKRFETKEIWGYRHPAVMNIGAARKKSITSFTNSQTLVILELFENYGVLRHHLRNKIPLKSRIEYFIKLPNNERHCEINDKFISKDYYNDEAYIYAYILNAIKRSNSLYHKIALRDFQKINETINLDFKKLIHNALLEIVVTNHLQDELDIVFTDKNDSTILILEIKSVPIKADAVRQTQKYLDLMDVIHPGKKISANIIGTGAERGINVDDAFKGRIALVTYDQVLDVKHGISFKTL